MKTTDSRPGFPQFFFESIPRTTLLVLAILVNLACAAAVGVVSENLKAARDLGGCILINGASFLVSTSDFGLYWICSAVGTLSIFLASKECRDSRAMYVAVLTLIPWSAFLLLSLWILSVQCIPPFGPLR